MPTVGVKDRSVNKGNAHHIIMSKIKKIYKMDTLNVSELSRLCDISYDRLRRLLFDNKMVWGADEWFKVMVVCGADGAVPQMYKSTRRDLAKYQQSLRYKNKIPKSPGPKKGYKEKEIKLDPIDLNDDETFDE